MGIKAYKGFHKDMTCRGFQFKEGQSYQEDKAKLCEIGFHACEHPLGCFGHYAPSQSVYHEVELDEVTDEKESDTKRCGKKIRIGARLDIAGIVKAAVDFVFEKADWSKNENHATGYQGAASATGDQGAASATGRYGAASALGIKGMAMGALGCWIICAEWKETKPFNWERVDIRCAKVDGEKIKPNTWYVLKDGEFAEVDE